MSAPDNFDKAGGAAFPMLPPDTEMYQAWPAHPGMSLRDYFAIRILAAMISADDVGRLGHTREEAKTAYFWADAMLAEREA